MAEDSPGLAKLTWTHPQSGERQEYVLAEGATATIGRLADNDICVPEQHVSRNHAVITSRSGVFVIDDAGSANGTWVNDTQIDQPFPLASGDEIRLYVPVLKFSSTVTEQERTRAAEQGTLITAVSTASGGKARLIITTGPQEGNTIPLLLNELTVGRATNNATWEIALQDASVSRPHARLEIRNGGWSIFDLGSSNGTRVNGANVDTTGYQLQDGDIIEFGATLALFRAG